MADVKVGEEEEVVLESGGKLPAATDLELQLTHQAAREFQAGRLDSCLNILAQLINSRGQDSKVLHNRAVVQYYKSDMARTDEFKKSLQEISHKSRFTMENVGTIEDIDQCILYYNHAVILYHLHQYTRSLNIIDKLHGLIESMDETLSKKVLFLLIELHLCMKQPEKALSVVGAVEKLIFGNGKGSQDKDKGGQKEKLDPAQVAQTNELYRLKISQYKIRCLMMSKWLRVCRKELKTLLAVNQPTITMTYLKANYEYLRNNLRKSIKILNCVAPPTKLPPKSGDCLQVMFYNNLAVCHFHLKKHNLGSYYMRKAIHENGLAAKEYNTVDPTKTLSGRPIYTIAVSRHYELLYNMGVQLLHCGKPVAAFDCLIQALEQSQVNPRLWLRLAECCIMLHKESNNEDRKLTSRLQVVQGSEGSGIHRKLVLGSGIKTEPLSGESASTPAATLEFGSLCLRNALMLLPEDPTLRKSPRRTTESEDGDKPASTEPALIPAPPGNPMRPSEVDNLRCSILASSAYVSLCLNDHVVALQHAQQLLKQHRLSGAHSYLAHMYQAEALVKLDRIADAVTHLDPDLVADVSTTFPDNKQDLDKDRNGDKDQAEQDEVKGALYTWCPRDMPQAQAIMQHNLAAAHATRGEYEKALINLTQSTQSIGLPLPAQTYFLKLYLELMEGRRKASQNIIKEHFGHVTPNRF